MPVQTFHIDSSKTKNFIQFVEKLYISPYKNPGLYMKLVEKEFQNIFPENLVSTLKDMAKTGEPSLIVIKEMPIDSIIPKAESLEERKNKKKYVSEASILGITSLMECKLDSSKQEQNGNIIHDVSPIKGHENKISSKGKEPFYLHTESTYHDNPPDFLMLLGLEGDPTAKTSYFFINDIIERIPQDIIEKLMKPEFEIHSGHGLDRHESIIKPLISYDENTKLYRIRLFQNDDRQNNDDRIQPLTNDAKQALLYLKKIFSHQDFSMEKIQGICLDAGDAIIFNNGWGINKISGIMHGRAGHINNPSRWLQRGFLFHLTPEDKIKLSDDYYRALSMVIQQRRFSLKESSRALKLAMLDSADAKAYKTANPTASESCVLLNSVNYLGFFKQHTTPWLKRITQSDTLYRQYSQSTTSSNDNNNTLTFLQPYKSENKTYYKLLSTFIEHNISYREIKHPAEGRSEEIARIRGSRLEQGAKALVVCANHKDRSKTYFLAVIPADKKLELKKIKQYSGAKDVSIVERTQAEALTSCKTGAIPPFTFNEDLKLLVDPELLQKNEEIVFNAGRLDRSIFLKSSDYLKIANAVQVPLTSEANQNQFKKELKI